MANAAMFRYVDLSPGTIGDRQVSVLTGDLPDWYHTLRLPSEFAEFFALPLVSARDLAHALFKETGQVVDPPSWAVGVGLVTPVMGWSWAVVLAHWTMEDLLERSHKEFVASQRLSYQLPVPQMVGGCDFLHWEFIDDLGALVLGDTAEDSVDRARAVGSEVRAQLRSKGFGFHKDTYGADGVSLGHEVSPMTYGVRANRRAFWQAVGRTEALLRRGRCSWQELSSLVGLWSWIMCAAKPSIAVWGQVYAFLRASEGSAVELVPPGEVLAELQAVLHLSVFLECPLTRPWSWEVLMVDSSLQGAAVCQTRASSAEVLAEARHCEAKGWQVSLDGACPVDDLIEDCGSESDEDCDILAADAGQGPPNSVVAPLPRFRPQPVLPVVRVLHTFSGCRRNGDLEHVLKAFAQEVGLLIQVESIDLEISPEHDLRSDTFFDGLKAACRNGCFDAHVSGPPCRTWSRARHGPGGPPPLRTRSAPYGRPGLTERQRVEVDADTLLFRRSVLLSAYVASAGGVFVIENPADPGRAPFPSIFVTEEAESLRQGFGATDVVFDQCVLGLSHRKPTQLLTNSQEVVRAFRRRRCHHPPGTHRPLRGRTLSGGFITKGAATYPHELCVELGHAIGREIMVAARGRAVDREPCPGEGKPVVPRWLRRRAPSAAEAWTPVRRWFEVFRVRWKRLEHNNIGELRIAVMALRHLARTKRHWDRRHLIFTDSLVTLGALVKGRSSSWALLRLAREAAVLQLVLGLRPYWRYIETHRNVADGPSRGYGVGHAPPSAAFVDARPWKGARPRNEHR